MDKDCYAELNIWGEDLDEHKISKILRMEVPYIREKGDYSAGPENACEFSLPGENRVSVWSYKTKTKKSTCISEIIEDIIKAFATKTDEFNIVKERFCVHSINITAVIYGYKKGTPSIHLTKKQIDFMAKIGASFEVDVY